MPPPKVSKMDRVLRKTYAEMKDLILGASGHFFFLMWYLKIAKRMFPNETLFLGPAQAAFF